MIEMDRIRATKLAARAAMSSGMAPDRAGEPEKEVVTPDIPANIMIIWMNETRQ